MVMDPVTISLITLLIVGGNGFISFSAFNMGDRIARYWRKKIYSTTKIMDSNNEIFSAVACTINSACQELPHNTVRTLRYVTGEGTPASMPLFLPEVMELLEMDNIMILPLSMDRENIHGFEIYYKHVEERNAFLTKSLENFGMPKSNIDAFLKKKII
jgi:hypothetical protein